MEYMNILKGLRSIVAMACLAFALPSLLYADVSDAGSVRTMEKQIATLQNLISKQNREIQFIKSQIHQGSGKVSTTHAAAPAPMDKNDFKELMGKTYKWMPGLTQKGDIRLRYEAFDSHSCDPTTGPGGCDRSRNRFRFRLRWGLEKKLSNEFKVGFRLASGGTGDPTSTNQTFGGYFTNKTITIDQAYAIYKPNLLQDFGLLESFEMGGGKFALPFKKYSSKMIWDRDVTPEGVYEKATIGLLNTEDWNVKWDIIGGQMVTAEGSGANADAELFAIQTGLDVSTYAFGTSRPVESRSGVSFYHYSNFDRTIGGFLRGNTAAAEQMEVLNLYQEFKFYPWDKPFTIHGEYATNLGNINKAAGIIDGSDSNAFAIGAKLGKAKKKGTWEGFLNYYYIGANSTAAVFGDSDIGLGYTNGKGWNLGVGYAFTDFLTLKWSNFLISPVTPFAGSSNSEAQDIYRSQLDLIWKF